MLMTHSFFYSNEGIIKKIPYCQNNASKIQNIALGIDKK